MSFSRDEGLDPRTDGRVQRAEEQIHALEQESDRENFVRQVKRETHPEGGPVRRALARVFPSLNRPPVDHDDEGHGAGDS